MRLKLLVKTLALLGLLVVTLPSKATAEETQLLSSTAMDLKVLADSQLRKGETLSAIETYKKAIASDPSLKAVYFNLAVAYYANHQIEQAAKSLEILIQVSPCDTEAIYNLGCLKLYLGDVKEAEKYFQEAASSCEPTSRFKPLLENGIFFLDKVKQLDSQTQQSLFLLFRQGVVPAFTS